MSNLIPHNSIEGIVTLEFVDIRTGKTRTVEKKNVITNYGYERLISQRILNNNGFFQDSLHVFLSSNSSPADRNIRNGSSLPTMVGVSSSASQSTNNTTNEPYFVQWFFQFPNPGAGNARTFRTVGLTSSSNIVTVPGTNNIIAYTVLTENCVQGDFEFLNAFYRFQMGSEIPRNTRMVGDAATRAKNWFICLSSTEDFGRIGSGSKSLWFQDIKGSSMPNSSAFPYTNPYHGPDGIQDPYTAGWAQPASQGNHQTAYSVLAEYAVGTSVTYTNGLSVGKIMRTNFKGRDLIHSLSNLSYSSLNIQSPGNIQGVFGHSNTAPGPFFDALHSPNGSGRVFVEGSWNGSWPETYFIDIQTNGAVGTSTYRYRKMLTTGFAGNSYWTSDYNIPYINYFEPAFPKAHGQRLDIASNYIRYSETSIVFWDINGVSLINMATGEYRTWDSTTSPSLPCFNIAQCAVDGKYTSLTTTIPSTKIYVADKSNGLFEIDVLSNTITQLDPIPCYGVAIGFQDNIVAFFDDGVTFNNTFTRTVLNLSGNPVNPITVSYIKTDKSSSNFNSIIVLNGVTLYWFSATLANLVLIGTVSSIRSNRVYGTVECSDYGSVWCAAASAPGNFNLQRITYPNTWVTLSSVVPNEPGTNFGVSFIGDKALVGALRFAGIQSYQVAPTHELVFPTFAGSHESYVLLDIPTNTIFLNLVTNVRASPRSSTFISHRVHMAGGIIFEFGEGQTFNVGRELNRSTLFYRSSINSISSLSPSYPFFESYGWNATTSEWELGNLNGRPTHLSAQPLQNGITVRFENGPSGTSFINGDYYTSVCCTGLMKDNATTASFTSSTYFKPTYILEPLPAGVTIATTVSLPITTDPEFVKFLRDYTHNHELFIDGTPAALRFTGAPSPGEVTINNTDYTLNAADVGKTLTGFTSYIRHI